MDEQKRPRAWVYARIPGDYDGTMNSYKVCSMQALHDGCDIVGGSIDERGGWLLRPGYRDMLRQIKAGKVDRVYICRMRQVSGKERHLYSFFKRLIAAADSFDGFITELQNMGYTVKYGPRVEHIAVRHKDAQRNIRIDRLDPHFSETALREYYRQLHRMPTEMQQEYRQENAPAKPKWQSTELQPTVRRARYLGKLPRRYPKVSGFMACYYHYCALLRKAYHGKATKRCYFLLREDFLLFSRYQRQTKFLWENHIETMDELLAYKENAETQIQQLARQRKVLYRQKREPERAARKEKIKSLTQQMKALRHEVYIYPAMPHLCCKPCRKRGPY